MFRICDKVLIYSDKFVIVCFCGLVGKIVEKRGCLVYWEECMSYNVICMMRIYM